MRYNSTKEGVFIEKELSKTWRALIEFDILKKGDRILIGLSGGKDSMFLVYALTEIKKRSPIPFDLACFTVNPMFSGAFPKKELEDFCSSFNIPFYTEDLNIPSAIKDEGPCYTCSYFRWATLNRKAKKLGFNKVALAHHGDDAAETFFHEPRNIGTAFNAPPVHLSFQHGTYGDKATYLLQGI
ncbi:MAG: hypothetical protein LUD41_07500 [Phascolarctobacterium sp.]|nr:hypothetical protein [Phascolarctobacterium sp.]